MALIPQEPIEQQINHLIENDDIIEWPRHYIGYSSLGGECLRRTWYSFRWVKMKVTSRRMKRLFDRGHWEEHRIIADLKRIGCKFEGAQIEVVGLAEHILGHIDGKASDIPGLNNETVLAEFKTCNDKWFKKYLKSPVKKVNIGYYGQSQLYMGQLGLKHTLFIVTNKNDERRHIEIIDFDEDYYRMLIAREVEILTTDEPPEQIGGPTWFACKYCEFHSICHRKAKILKSCRSCQRGTIEEAAAWSCELDDHILDLEAQKAACQHYILLETLSES